MNEHDELKDRLKAARKALKLTQKELAEIAGTSQVTIQQLESGRNDTSKKLKELALALGVTMDWLAHGREGIREDTPTYTAELFNNNNLPLGPIVLSMEQAANPVEQLKLLGGNPNTPRALTSPLGPDSFGVILIDDAMKGSDERARADLDSWQKGDILLFVSAPEEIEPGRPVIVRVEGKKNAVIGLFKPMEDSDDYELIPLNPMFTKVSINSNRPGEIVGALKRSMRERDNF